MEYKKVELGTQKLKRLDWLKPAELKLYTLQFGSQSPTFDLWILHDETCAKDSELYGASKLRKLAYILPKLIQEGAQELLTVGSQGSHHVLSTCVAGQRLGLPVHVALTPQEHSSHSNKIYEQTYHLAHSVTHFKAQTSQKFAQELKQWQQQFTLKHSPLIPTGGSCLFGVFGMVEAVYELVECLFNSDQSNGHKTPIPSDLYMATASGSSLAGLLLGLSLAWPSTHQLPKVFGVRVSDQSLVNRKKVLRLLTEAKEFLSVNVLVPYFEILGDFIGPGYGLSTAEAQTAIKWAHNHDLKFDLSYTAKAFGALLSRERRLFLKTKHQKKPHIDSPQNQTQKVFLFWHSLDTRLAIQAPH